MKEILFIFLLMMSCTIFSQNKYKDYVVTHENDTIYGLISGVGLYDNNGKRYKIEKELVKTFRYQDEIYHLKKVVHKSVLSKKKELNKGEISSDSIINLKYGLLSLFSINRELYVTTKKKVKDYIVTFTNDTIYGKIKKFTGQFKERGFISDEGSKFVIRLKKVNSFRLNGDIFRKRKVHGVNFPGRSNEYIKVLLIGRINLYEQTWGSSIHEKRYYIEKNNKLKLVLRRRIILSVKKFISDNEELVKRVEDNEVGYGNLYYFIKEYNDLN